MRYIQVAADGSIGGMENIGNIKYGYGHMLILRVQMTFLFARNSTLKTLGYLYTVLKQRGVENHPQHRKFLLDRLCLGAGIFLANTKTVELFKEYQKNIEAK